MLYCPIHEYMWFGVGISTVYKFPKRRVTQITTPLFHLNCKTVPYMNVYGLVAGISIFSSSQTGEVW